jgi:hypothetical protein
MSSSRFKILTVSRQNLETVLNSAENKDFTLSQITPAISNVTTGIVSDYTVILEQSQWVQAMQKLRPNLM